MARNHDGHCLTDLQAEVDQWHRDRWPSADPTLVALKVAEEAGEVAGARVKMIEGRRVLADLTDEMGDVIIALCALAGRLDVDLLEVVAERWAEVSTR